MLGEYSLNHNAQDMNVTENFPGKLKRSVPRMFWEPVIGGILLVNIYQTLKGKLHPEQTDYNIYNQYMVL